MTYICSNDYLLNKTFKKSVFYVYTLKFEVEKHFILFEKWETEKQS